MHKHTQHRRSWQLLIYAFVYLLGTPAGALALEGCQTWMLAWQQPKQTTVQTGCHQKAIKEAAAIKPITQNEQLQTDPASHTTCQMDHLALRTATNDHQQMSLAAVTPASIVSTYTIVSVPQYTIGFYTPSPQRLALHTTDLEVENLTFLI